jgi:hypothetical protein
MPAVCPLGSDQFWAMIRTEHFREGVHFDTAGVQVSAHKLEPYLSCIADRKA